MEPESVVNQNLHPALGVTGEVGPRIPTVAEFLNPRCDFKLLTLFN